MLVVSGPNMLIIYYSYHQIRRYVVIGTATFLGVFPPKPGPVGKPYPSRPQS